MSENYLSKQENDANGFHRYYVCTECKQEITNIDFVNEDDIAQEDNHIINLLLESHTHNKHPGLDILFDIIDFKIPDVKFC